MAPPRLELVGITKRYPGIIANDAISFSVMPGEIHAVLGENGAGKSTLMKIIHGAIAADEGELRWNGERIAHPGPATARRLGIGMVHQHFSLFESVTVAENVAVALDGRYDLAATGRRLAELAGRYGLPVEPDRLLHHLSVGERQRVEILRCLMLEPRLLILDEPTSVLPPQAVERLFAVLRRLAADGCSILYVSHKLEEIRALCHAATVLRAGRVVGSADPRRASAAELARLMVGAALPRLSRRPPPPADPAATRPVPRLEVAGLTAPAEDPFGTDLRDISFSLDGGEILGIAGVSGNGQAELMALLSGERTLPAADMILLDGRPVGDLAAGRRRALGLGFVPEERLGRGAVPGMTLAENTLLTAHREAGLVRRGLVARDKVRGLAGRIIERFGVRCTGPGALAQSLSGGNLQKFIMGREILLGPRVLLVAQPSWGVDVAAAGFIRQALLDLARAGTAILVVSEELEELLEVSDRLMVLHRGRLSAPRPIAGLGLEEIGLMMAGA